MNDGMVETVVIYTKYILAWILTIGIIGTILGVILLAICGATYFAYLWFFNNEKFHKLIKEIFFCDD